MSHCNHMHHPFSFPKWPKQSDFHAHWCAHAFGKKRGMFQVCSMIILFCLTFQLTLMFSIPLLMDKMHQACNHTTLFSFCTQTPKHAPQQILKLGQHYTSFLALYIRPSCPNFIHTHTHTQRDTDARHWSIETESTHLKLASIFLHLKLSFLHFSYSWVSFEDHKALLVGLLKLKQAQETVDLLH